VAIQDQQQPGPGGEDRGSHTNHSRAVLGKSWEAIALLDAEGTVQYASPSTDRVLGYSPEEIVGQNLLGLVSVEDRRQAGERFSQSLAAAGAGFTSTFRCRHKDGSWRWIENVFTNLLAEPGVGAVVANYHDVTEHKQMEEELRERASRLAEADRRKDEFLAMLAHELRNPLAPVLNSLHLLRLSESDPQAVERARTMMERQIRHMARLVDDLLDVGRMARNGITLHRERLDLATLVREEAEDHLAELEKAGLTLVVDVPATPIWVAGDSTRLTQVLADLLGNAVKFTDPGGLVFIALKPDSEKRQAALSVRDTGIGIEAEMLPVIFDVFAQADRSLERTRGGLGLGLSLVKGLVQLHGGTVLARSEGPGRGAEFVVRLPLEGEPAALSGSLEPARPAEEGLRVLVVEDNRDAAESLRLLLELLGHKVMVAYTGPDGVRAAVEWRPDIVLCDIGLPGMDGFGVAGTLRRNPATARARLIALTGYSRDEDRRHAREVGFDLHLVKPVDPHDLVNLLSPAGSKANASRPPGRS